MEKKGKVDLAGEARRVVFYVANGCLGCKTSPDLSLEPRSNFGWDVYDWRAPEAWELAFRFTNRRAQVNWMVALTQEGGVTVMQGSSPWDEVPAVFERAALVLTYDWKAPVNGARG